MDVLAGLACDPDQTVKWNGTAWSCAEDEIGAAPPPDVLAGLKCEPGQIAGWNGTDWICANDTTGVSPFFTKFPSSVLVDSDDLVGQHVSAVIGSDGLALIAYFDETNGDLKVAHCNDADCWWPRFRARLA